MTPKGRREASEALGWSAVVAALVLLGLAAADCAGRAWPFDAYPEEPLGAAADP